MCQLLRSFAQRFCAPLPWAAPPRHPPQLLEVEVEDLDLGPGVDMVYLLEEIRRQERRPSHRTLAGTASSARALRCRRRQRESDLLESLHKGSSFYS